MYLISIEAEFVVLVMKWMGARLIVNKIDFVSRDTSIRNSSYKMYDI